MSEHTPVEEYFHKRGVMAYKTETFDTAEERNARWQELRRLHPGTIRYSGSEKTENQWQTKFYVGYPVSLTPGAVHE